MPESVTTSPLMTPPKLVPVPLPATVSNPSYTFEPVKVPATVMVLGVMLSKPLLMKLTEKPGLTTPLLAVMA